MCVFLYVGIRIPLVFTDVCIFMCSGERLPMCSLQKNKFPALLQLIKTLGSFTPSALCLPMPQLDEQASWCPHPSSFSIPLCPHVPPSLLSPSLLPGCSCAVTGSASSPHAVISLREDGAVLSNPSAGSFKGDFATSLYLCIPL